MLAPDSRALLLDALRPPTGYQLEHAVATTFTLDLNSALMVPLALAGFNLSGSPDLIAVMEALRSSADKVDIFAQAGMIKTASWPGDLTALLESSIHTVHRPRPGHLFHPKLWVLKFVRPEGFAEYRCIVSSRNLTADRSWDVLLRLDSEPDISRRNPGNNGLVHLIEALTSMSGGNLDVRRRQRLESLATELKRVTWQMPEGADSIRFVAFGVPGGLPKKELGSLFRGYRHLVISPFLTEGGIGIILGDSGDSEVTVVSRVDQLDMIEASHLHSCDLFSVNRMAGLEDNDNESDEGSALLGDLHAKLYVVESNRRGFVYVGSTNATEAAFGGNVELLCELSGGAKKLGVDLMMGDKAPFRTILEPYVSPSEAQIDLRAEATHRLDSYLVDLAECELTLSVTTSGDLYSATLASKSALPPLPQGDRFSLSISPMNRSGERFGLEPRSRVGIDLEPREAGDLTAFFVVKAAAVIDGFPLERSAVLRAVILGNPTERFDNIMIRQLDSPEKFIRFLMLLLSLGSGAAPNGLDASLGGEGIFSRSSEGLFELLLRALAVQPESVDRLSAIVENLQKAGKAKQVLPEGWDSVWQAIREARELIGRQPK